MSYAKFNEKFNTESDQVMEYKTLSHAVKDNNPKAVENFIKQNGTESFKIFEILRNVIEENKPNTAEVIRVLYKSMKQKNPSVYLGQEYSARIEGPFSTLEHQFVFKDLLSHTASNNNYAAVEILCSEGIINDEKELNKFLSDDFNSQSKEAAKTGWKLHVEKHYAPYLKEIDNVLSTNTAIPSVLFPTVHGYFKNTQIDSTSYLDDIKKFVSKCTIS